MSDTGRNFIAGEMSSINYGADSIKPEIMQVAFRNPGFLPGTKWINITQEQYQEIERILTLGRIEG